MARPSKYPRELRERAVRMVLDSKDDYPSEFEAIRSIAAKLGIGSSETLRKWVRRAEVDAGERPGTTTEESAQLKALKKENAELRRANEILKSASGFLRGGARLPTPVLVDFIDEHRDRFGVEPICRVLSEHGCRIAPSTYYDARKRQPSKRKRRDEEVKALIEAERAKSKFVRLLGARKMWLRLRGQGHEVARCTIERLYREMGISGVTRAKGPRTTIADEHAERPVDRVDRLFAANRPNELWCADFTYVPTWSGMVYVAFVFDVFSRRILGWRAATTMTTPLVLDCLEQAIWTRQREGVDDLSGLVHHTDAGSQYTSIAFTERLIDAGVDASVGSVGDAYDSALAESQIGLYKSELIWPHGPWRNREHVEIETLDWVHWFNHQRTHESVDDLTPIQVEQFHYTHRTRLPEAS
ncbi:IS3 family transposase [Solicola gregarius]|uniref:IS3 family transposase n=1 Tax=Solicola gregarius TaxID=2908642 RepID=A0AA46TIR9_9ACTN|nr:IS3 family transposase [Solicola gregarius]UYM05629.1 IS3 family transposase [Solicola gregarius]